MSGQATTDVHHSPLREDTFRPTVRVPDDSWDTAASAGGKPTLPVDEVIATDISARTSPELIDRSKPAWPESVQGTVFGRVGAHS